LDVLKTRKESAKKGCQWVFPATRSDSRSGHLNYPQRAWVRICERAGLKNIRIHDLRRTLGSWQAATGASLPIIGKSLGHKNQSTTQIYARLNLDPVRESVDAATAAMMALAKPDEVKEEEQN
jgi:integrase